MIVDPIAKSAIFIGCILHFWTDTLPVVDARRSVPGHLQGALARRTLARTVRDAASCSLTFSSIGRLSLLVWYLMPGA
jgi:hypothetical protein